MNNGQNSMLGTAKRNKPILLEDKFSQCLTVQTNQAVCTLWISFQ